MSPSSTPRRPVATAMPSVDDAPSADMPADAPVIVWFRNDLRLSDNPALSHAVASGRPVLCLFVHDPQHAREHALGAAAQWWLDGGLRALHADLARMGAVLHVACGDALALVPRMVAQAGAAEVVWNRRYDPLGRETDTAIKATLKHAGVIAHSFAAGVLYEPWTVRTRAGDAFRVFTAWWRAARASGEPLPPLPAPGHVHAAVSPGAWEGCCVGIDALRLVPVSPDWAGGLREAWQPGEAQARDRLHHFVDGGLGGYADARDRPDLPATSRLSPDLRFGHISPRQAWHAAVAAVRGGAAGGMGEQDLEKFLSELGWRDFAVSLLYAQPELVSCNFRTEFDAMPWRNDARDLCAWQQGRTGYPIVDAGMRQLWRTGWMHNRVRMIVASFLTKHLLCDWRMGEAWFRDTLVDADIASNVINWQWVAGCGVDAAPYFRVFNPVLQARRFDPDGTYVRRWVPELAGVPTSCVHAPWTCDPAIRARVAYPSPIVDLQGGRARALAAWKGLSDALHEDA